MRVRAQNCVTHLIVCLLVYECFGYSSGQSLIRWGSKKASERTERVVKQASSRQQDASKLQYRQAAARPAGSQLRLHSTSTRRSNTTSKSRAPTVPAAAMGLASIEDYKCAKYCTCSLIQVFDSSKLVETPANLTRAKCENPKFSDVLSIDRRTQIIHISLPTSSSPSSDSPLAASSLDQAAEDMRTESDAAENFRMPRLIQFSLLREIAIVNLNFEVCDSEVFKRGQKLRRIRWNQNKLKQISKSCFKHLDQLVDLNLDYNLLEELESALFSQLLQLKYLSIAHNNLVELAAHQFANLTNLISLNLIGNSFKIINLHLFEPMQLSLKHLNLAQNEIKSFVHNVPVQATLLMPAFNQNKTNHSEQVLSTNQTQKLPFVGVIFKNLIRLNVDENKFERVKALLLHRFFNVKYLSIRQNNIASIRDKAFNGLKLIELNLASNSLQNISKCAFCNSTIKRLILFDNNVTVPAIPLGSVVAPAIPATINLNLHDTAIQLSVESHQPQHSSTGMLALSDSIFGPLFNHLEYLDLSHNHFLADQMEVILEPLLQLQYLNLASVGFDRSLPSPTLFKNQRHLKYLNLSSNLLDQLIAETLEPLSELEVLDLSQNKFNEMDESLLVTLDEMPALKLVNMASNPWYCSQCKIGPLYDWILRSAVYNSTCIAPSISMQAAKSGQADAADLEGYVEPNDDQVAPSELEEADDMARENYVDDFYSVDDDVDSNDLNKLMLDLDLFKAFVWRPTGDPTISTSGQSTATSDETATSEQSPNSYSFSHKEPQRVAAKWDKLASKLLGVAGEHQRDRSIVQTLSSMIAANRLAETQLGQSAGSPVIIMREHFATNDFCLKCEFPSELREFTLHELTPGDFKYCLGSAPRFSASEPKVGLTLAIVIIGALFCIIIIVIVVYRKKSNTYYPSEDSNEQLDEQAAGSRKQRPVLSVSSDVDHQFNGGDVTDYSSPPMSQSYESYSNESAVNEDLAEEEEEQEDEDEEDEEDYYDEEEMDDYDDERDDDDDDDDDDDGGGGGGGHGSNSNEDSNVERGGGGQGPAGSGQPPPKADQRQATDEGVQTSAPIPIHTIMKRSSTEQQPQQQASRVQGQTDDQTQTVSEKQTKTPNASRSGSRQQSQPASHPTEVSSLQTSEALAGQADFDGIGKQQLVHHYEQSDIERPLNAADLRPSKAHTENEYQQHHSDLYENKQTRNSQKLVQLASIAGSLVHESNLMRAQHSSANQPGGIGQNLPRPGDQPSQYEETPRHHVSAASPPSHIASLPRLVQRQQTHSPAHGQKIVRAAKRQSSEHSTASSQAILGQHRHQPPRQQHPLQHQQRQHTHYQIHHGHYGSQKIVRPKRERMVQASQTIGGHTAANGSPSVASHYQSSLDSPPTSAGQLTPIGQLAYGSRRPKQMEERDRVKDVPAQRALIRQKPDQEESDGASASYLHHSPKQQSPDSPKLASINVAPSTSTAATQATSGGPKPLLQHHNRPRLARQNNSGEAIGVGIQTLARAAPVEEPRSQHEYPLHAHFSNPPSDAYDDEYYNEENAELNTDDYDQSGGYGGAALEIQVDEEYEIGGTRELEELNDGHSKLEEPVGLVRTSNSTHSALTQTGSGDFV